MAKVTFDDWDAREGRELIEVRRDGKFVGFIQRWTADNDKNSQKWLTSVLGHDEKYLDTRDEAEAHAAS